MSEDKLDTLTDEELAALPDDELELMTGSAILSAAVMNGSRWSEKFHQRVDRAYAECARRKRGIYQRAYNSAVRSQGHHRMVSDVKDGMP